jgi:hypothetical protein
VRLSPRTLQVYAFFHVLMSPRGSPVDCAPCLVRMAGCSRMSNAWSIVDIQYHCGQDEVAFRYNKFKGVDYWICYRCVFSAPRLPGNCANMGR